MNEMNEIMLIVLLKLYAAFMILGSGVLWSIFFRDQYKSDNNPRAWVYFGLIIAGLLLALYFMDGWRPPGK